MIAFRDRTHDEIENSLNSIDVVEARQKRKNDVNTKCFIRSAQKEEEDDDDDSDQFDPWLRRVRYLCARSMRR